MSNYYAKAINPRTDNLERCAFLDTPNGYFISFDDGWKYNLKYFPDMFISDEEMTEQEAINQDGDETIEYFGDPISRSEFWAYIAVGLFALAFPIVIAWLIVSYFLK